MDISLLARLNVEKAARRAAVILSDVDAATSQLILENEKSGFDGVIGQALTDAFLNGKSKMIEADGRRYFINIYLPPTRLVIIGAVHISQRLVGIAGGAFDLTIIDPRTAFATEERFNNVNLCVEWPQEVLARQPLDPYCAVVALTHDPKIDDFAIMAGLHANCYYVGALGSRKTHAKRLQRLGEEGMSADQLGRIKAPIGLDIGAANPAEIAVAILAEVIGAFRRREIG